MNAEDFQIARLLVISTGLWPSAGQVASALGLAGFHVAIVCPIDSPACRLRKLNAHFPYRSSASSASIQSAIAMWSPDVLVCADDLAVQELHSLYFKASNILDQPKRTRLMNLIELSLGDPHSFVATLSKSEILLQAKSLGIICPQTITLTDNLGFAREDSGMVFPIMVKTDDAWGGLGVRRVNDQLELRAAITELSLPYNWPGPLKRFIGRLLRRVFFRWLSKWPRKMSIQEYVVGRPCNCAVVCWKGKVLAGITVDVLKTSYEFGPSTIVRVIDHPSVTAAAEKIVAKLNLSGFLGFDFILDPANKVWFLEMNPRATPTSHICARDQDLAGSFFSQITGKRPKAVGRVIHQDLITLFPAEALPVNETMIPNASSGNDTPDDEPEFVEACRAREQKKMRRRFWRLRKSNELGPRA
jgi:hypothetical protein